MLLPLITIFLVIISDNNFDKLDNSQQSRARPSLDNNLCAAKANTPAGVRTNTHSKILNLPQIGTKAVLPPVQEYPKSE